MMTSLKQEFDVDESTFSAVLWPQARVFRPKADEKNEFLTPVRKCDIIPMVESGKP